MSGRRAHALLLWLAAAALVLGPAGGAHLHLCLGAQAPLSVHTLLVPGHHDHHQAGGHGAGPAAQPGAPDRPGTGPAGGHPAGGHDDLDLDLAGAALAKAGKSAPDLPLLAVLCVLALAVLVPARRGVLRPVPAAWAEAPHARPPQRGPPRVSLS